MATNFIADGERVTVTAPYAVTANDIVTVGSLFGVALTDAASAASVVLQTSGVMAVTHVTTTAAASAGALAYLDTTAKAISATTTYPKVGVFTEAKATTTTACVVRFNGTF